MEQSNLSRNHQAQNPEIIFAQLAGLLYAASFIAVSVIVLVATRYYLQFHFGTTQKIWIQAGWFYWTATLDFIIHAPNHYGLLNYFHEHPYYIYIVRTCFALPVIPCIIAAYRQAYKAETDEIKIGIDVLRDPGKAYAAFKKKLSGATGAKFHNEFRLASPQTETEGILFAGAVGAGKSQALSRVIESIKKNNHSAIIYDIKQDYVSQLIGDSNSILLSPTDARSAIWAISHDVRSSDDCNLLSEAFIQSSGKESNPYFTNAARQSFAGAMDFLRQTEGKKWDLWSVLTLLSDAEALHNALKEISHPALSNIQVDEDGNMTPQTQGVMGNISTAITPFYTIAKIWRRSKNKRISIRNLITSCSKRPFKLILGNRADAKLASNALTSAILNLAISHSLTLGEDRKRALWYIVDELGYLPKLESLVDLMTLGRGYGMRICLGIQDAGRLQSKYGKDEAMTILSQCSTHIIGRLGDSDTAEWAAKLFGQQRVDRKQITVQNQFAGSGIMAPNQQSTQISETDKAALLDSDFLSLPKASLKNGFFMWVRTTGTDDEIISGKIHYDINIIKEPYEKFVPVPTTGNSKRKTKKTGSPKVKSSGSVAIGSGLARGQEQKKQKQDKRQRQDEDVIVSQENHGELHDATPDVNKAGKEVGKTAANVITNQLQDKAIEGIGHAVGAPDSAIAAVEAVGDVLDVAQEAHTASEIGKAGVSVAKEGKQLRRRRKKSLGLGL